MSTNRIKQRLGVETSKSSVNGDTFLKISLEGKERLLPSDEINKIVNLGDRFNVERQRSKFYRILGTINPTISNSLFNLDDNQYNNIQTLAGFNDYIFLDTSYPKDGDLSDLTDVVYADSINKNLKEINGWFGYFNPDKTAVGLCNFTDMEPIRERFSFIPDTNPFSGIISPVKNWELTITYPKTMDKTHNMVNGGLLIIEAISVTSSTRNMVAFGMGCLHNLIIGDTVKITGTTGYDGYHEVIRTGLDNGDLKEYYFVIDLPPTGIIDGISRMTRLYGGNESEYYFRKFKKIKTRSSIIETDDYETYKLAFSENVYGDPLSQYVFNEDIDITDLTDNLDRPLTELYLTMVKTDSAGLFTKITSGIETPYITKLNTSNINTYLKTIPAINKIHNGTTPFPTHTPLEPQLNISSGEFYGDLVEFNKYEVKETVLADVCHRFNTLNRETNANINYVNALGVTPLTINIDLGPRHEGYFYKAHNLIKIKELSSYIEQGDVSVDEVPSYAINLGDGRYLWRDILDIGFNESNVKPLDYPFLNGCHYMYQNNSFPIKRQDPFNIWGLYYAKFPADPIGEGIPDNFTINTENDVY